MSNKSLAAFLIVMATSVTQSIAQSDTEATKIIPPTPNAASLGQFGNVPVGLYTGHPNVSFPLYSITYNDLSIPIDLSYGYSGLKVEDYPGWVGMGWNVGGTGVINRQQRGVPDESAQGYNGQQQNGLKAVQFINDDDVDAHELYLNRVRAGVADSEPDMFTFSFPGHSGKFFFDETQCASTIKQAVVIPQQKMKIFGYFDYSGIYNWVPGIIEKFVIIDEKGIVYTFDVAEKAASSEPGDPDTENFANTWYMSEIETPNGNTVSYDYHPRVMDMPATVYERRVIPLSNPPNLAMSDLTTKQFTASSTTEQVLEQITFRGGYVSFVEGAIREDWDPSSWAHSKGMATERPKTLSKIVVHVAGRIAKEVEFSYSYFGSNARLRLDSFREVNGGEAKPPHVFEYRGGTVPPIGAANTIFSQDHWGYYTGTNANTLLPPLFEIMYLPDMSIQLINLAGNAREPSAIASSAGILEKITYPTKGYTILEYEANEYLGTQTFGLCSGDFDSQGMAGGIVETFGSVTDTYQLTVGSTSCLRVDYTLLAPCVDGVAEVKLYASQGVQILRHSIERKNSGDLLESNFGPASGETFAVDPGTYTLVVIAINENSCGFITKAKATVYKNIQAPTGLANLKAGGLRVSKISDCIDAESCISTYYDYRDVSDTTRSSGRLINDPVYRYDLPVKFADGEGTSQQDVYCANLVANSQVPLASASGSPIGYKYVTVRKSTDESNGRTENQFAAADDYPDIGILTYPFPPRISRDWKRGTQRNSSVFGLNGTETVKLTEQASDYCINQTYYRQIGFKPKKIRDSKCDYPLTMVDYEFESYSVSSGWSPLCNQQDTQYDHSTGNPVALSTTKEFTYGNPQHLQMTEVVTTDSKGAELTTTMKYVEDVATISGLTTQEASDIQSNPNKTAVIEKKELKGESLLSTTLKIYDGPQLKKVKFATGSAPLEDYVMYNQYDQFGNVLNYTTMKGDNNSYLWAYGAKFPVVEARNATHGDVYFTSFEEIGTTFDDGAGNNKAFSGIKVLNAGSYTIPASYVPSNPASTVMSYWYWQSGTWKFSGVVPFNANIVSPGTKLDEVRAFPRGAQLTTMTYDPAVGMTGVADVNSISAHYEYDAMGRLVRIRDFQGNVLKSTAYHYKGE